MSSASRATTRTRARVRWCRLRAGEIRQPRHGPVGPCVSNRTSIRPRSSAQRGRECAERVLVRGHRFVPSRMFCNRLTDPRDVASARWSALRAGFENAGEKVAQDHDLAGRDDDRGGEDPASGDLRGSPGPGRWLHAPRPGPSTLRGSVSELLGRNPGTRTHSRSLLMARNEEAHRRLADLSGKLQLDWSHGGRPGGSTEGSDRRAGGSGRVLSAAAWPNGLARG